MAAIAAITAPLASTANARDWIELRTAHYRLISDVSAADLRKVAVDMERFYEGFEAFWSKAPGKLMPCTILVFSRDSDFDAAKPTYRERASHFGAVFVGGIDHAFIAFPMSAFDSTVPAGRSYFGVADSRRTEFHESVHYLLSGLNRRPPAWFHEGIAELLSTAELSAKSITVGRAVEPYTVWLTHNGARPIAEIFPVTTDSPAYNDPAKAGAFYGHSWALLHFLLCGKDPEGPAQLVKFLQLTRGGTPTAETFRQAFGRDERTLDKQLRTYLDSGRYSVRTIPVSFSVNPANLDPKSMTIAEVDLSLAVFLLHTKRVADARPRVTRSLASLQNDPRAHEAAGLLALVDENSIAAEAHYREAVRLGSRRPVALTVTYGARLESKITTLDVGAALPAGVFEEIANGLKAAINANPLFSEAYQNLALALAFAPTPEKDDQAWLKQGLAVDPSNTVIRGALAIVMAQTGNSDEALALAKSVPVGDLPVAMRARITKFSGQRRTALGVAVLSAR